MSCSSIKTITPVPADRAVEGSIILPSGLAMIGTQSFNNAFCIDYTIDLFRVPASVVKWGNMPFVNLYNSCNNFEIGSPTEGSYLYLVSENRNLLDNSGSVSGNLYNHNSGRTTNLTFYYRSETQLTGFGYIVSYMYQIDNYNYVPVN